MKAPPNNSSATDMKAFQRISSATGEKADQGKTNKVEKELIMGLGRNG